MTNTTQSNNLYPIANGTTSSSPFVDIFAPRDPNSNDINYPTQKKWLNTTNNNFWMLEGFISNNGVVTANWIEIGGGLATEDTFVDTNTPPGTNPVVANNGAITVTGGQVAAGTTSNVIQTNSLAPNTYTIQVQRSQAVESSTVGDNGVCHFSSTDFTVDTNGFVALSTPILDYVSLTPYIVGPDIHSGYSTIQTAITAAVAGGASSSNPANIYIKPNTYIENVTLPDGINLMGMSQILPSIVNEAGSSVFLSGTIIYSGANSSITNINFTNISGNPIIIQSGTLVLSGCYCSMSSGQFIALTTTGNKTIAIQDCNFNGSGTASFFYTDGDNSSKTIIINRVFASFPGVSTITGSTSTLVIYQELSHIDTSWMLDCESVDYDARNCPAITGLGQAIVTSGSHVTEGFISFTNSNVEPGGGYVFDLTLGSGIVWRIQNCIGGSELSSWSYLESAANNSRDATFYIYDATAQATALVFNTQNEGWRGTQWQQMQAMVQTTSGSAQTLITLPVPVGSAVTLQGQITGSNAGHTDITGGNFLIVADGTAAAIIGSPVINVCASTSGTITTTFSAGNVLVQVTAPSSAAYNWVSTYQFQNVINNT